MTPVCPILPAAHDAVLVAISGTPPDPTLPEGMVVKPLPGLVLADGTTVITRWQLTDDERGRLLAGCDLWVVTLTTGDGMYPMALTIGPPVLELPHGPTEPSSVC